MNFIGFWNETESAPVFDDKAICSVAYDIRKAHMIIYNKATQQVGLGLNGDVSFKALNGSSEYPLIGIIPAMYPEWLGNRSFQWIHNVRFSYVGGAMARGIASSDLVIALAEAGMLGFFGSAGVSLERLQTEIDKMKNRLQPQGFSWGMNLIHLPEAPHIENSIVELYLKNGINKVEAAAFISLSKALVHFAFKGLSIAPNGDIVRMNHVFAKISRPEVVKHFLTPVPIAMLHELFLEGKLSKQEVEIGKNICIAEDITIEADSGGHTDSRPLGPLFSIIFQLRNQLCKQYDYAVGQDWE